LGKTNNSNQLIAEHQLALHKTINILAWAFGRPCPGLEIDDLVQEGWLILVKAIEKYDPEMGTINAWASTVLRNHFCKLLTQHSSEWSAVEDTGTEEDMLALIIDKEAGSLLKGLLSPAAKELYKWKAGGGRFVGVVRSKGWANRDLVLARSELREVGKLLVCLGVLE